jgi:hypothetical protein
MGQRVECFQIEDLLIGSLERGIGIAAGGVLRGDSIQRIAPGLQPACSREHVGDGAQDAADPGPRQEAAKKSIAAEMKLSVQIVCRQVTCRDLVKRLHGSSSSGMSPHALRLDI